MHRVESCEVGLQSGGIGRGVGVGERPGVLERGQERLEFPPLPGADDEAEQVPHVLLRFEELPSLASLAGAGDDAPVSKGAK
ncbi:MAG: hypothetical protein ACYTDE_11390, partial [Planctomycetota bacterium]